MLYNISSPLFVPNTRTQPRNVPLDWNHPITEGLVFAWNAGNGLKDSVTGVRGVFNLAGRKISVSPSGGLGLEGTGTGITEYIEWPNAPYRRLRGTTRLTAMSLVRSRQASHNLNSTPGIVFWGTSASPVVCEVNVSNPASLFRWYVGNGETVDSVKLATLTIPTTGMDKWHVLGGTYDGAFTTARLQ